MRSHKTGALDENKKKKRSRKKEKQGRKDGVINVVANAAKAGVHAG